MTIKKSRERIMGLAAIMVAIYHLFPSPMGNDLASKTLDFITKTSYIGVDIFFFLSGYMLYFSDSRNYGAYMKRKVKRIYPSFILAVLVYMAMGKLSFYKGILCLLNIDLFIGGGGSFLWFLQAIMVFYALGPLVLKIAKRFDRKKFLLAFSLAYFFFMLVLERLFENHLANIFLSRIPVFFMGSFLAAYEGREIFTREKSRQIFLFLTIVGLGLLWPFSYLERLDKPFTGFFYILALPAVIGIVGLADSYFKGGRGRIFELFGSLSLELYTCQMVLAGFLVRFFMASLGNVYLASLASCILIFVSSYFLNKAKKLLKSKFYNK